MSRAKVVGDNKTNDIRVLFDDEKKKIQQTTNKCRTYHYNTYIIILYCIGTGVLTAEIESVMAHV